MSLSMLNVIQIRLAEFFTWRWRAIALLTLEVPWKYLRNRRGDVSTLPRIYPVCITANLRDIAKVRKLPE